MIYSIYKITNNINNKCYIGYTSKEPKVRWSQHIINYNNIKVKFKLYLGMREFGIENFTFDVIYQTKDRLHALLEIEPKLILEYDSVSNGYNSSYAGINTNTDEQTRKNSDRMKECNPMKPGMVHSGSFKKGHKPKFTTEHKEKLKLSKLGSKNPMYGNFMASDHLNSKKESCSNCGIKTTIGNIARWHNQNCKILGEYMQYSTQ